MIKHPRVWFSAKSGSSITSPSAAVSGDLCVYSTGESDLISVGPALENAAVPTLQCNAGWDYLYRLAESLQLTLPKADDHLLSDSETCFNLLTLLMIDTPDLVHTLTALGHDAAPYLHRALEKAGQLEEGELSTRIQLLTALGSLDRKAAVRESILLMSRNDLDFSGVDPETCQPWMKELLAIGPGGMLDQSSDRAVHCLWVDDEVDLPILVRGMFRREIREGRCRFTFTTRGEAALAALEEHDDIDLVLTDINMPGMDGFQLTTAVKKRYPKMDVFIVTAYGDPTNIRHAMRQGARDFIPKPLDRTRIKDSLSRRYKPFPIMDLNHIREQQDIFPHRLFILGIDKYLPNLLTNAFRDQIKAGELLFRLFTHAEELPAALDEGPAPLGILIEHNPEMHLNTGSLVSFLRHLYPNTAVLVAGGPGELDDYRFYMARGAFEFVPRPVPIDDLKAMIEQTRIRTGLGRLESR